MAKLFTTAPGWQLPEAPGRGRIVTKRSLCPMLRSGGRGGGGVLDRGDHFPDGATGRRLGRRRAEGRACCWLCAHQAGFQVKETCRLWDDHLPYVRTGP